MINNKIASKMNELEIALKELESYLENFEQQNYKISRKVAGWHIDHSLRVITDAVFQLKNSNPKRFVYSFNLRRIVLFFRKKIKRKSFKSSSSNRNFGIITFEELKSQFELTKNNVTTLEKLNQKSNYKHSRFGLLNKEQTCLFLAIHTKHHIDIINDIIK